MPEEMILEIFQPYQYDWTFKLELPPYVKIGQMDITRMSNVRLARLKKDLKGIGKVWEIKRRPNATS